MIKRTVMISYFVLLGTGGAGCGGENAILVEPTSDGSAGSDASMDAVTSMDSTSTSTEAGTGDAGSDTGTEDGPGGDGGLVLGGNDAGADATFQLKSPQGTNLLSWSDVTTSCATVAGMSAGTFVMTCRESNGASGPCRTVIVVFGGGPATGRSYAAVAKDSPADGEAVVTYQESADCTAAMTNGWVQTKSGGDFTVDVYGDTAIRFTIHDVPLSPAPTSSTVTNHNAKGSFVLAGSGLSSFPYE